MIDATPVTGHIWQAVRCRIPWSWGLTNVIHEFAQGEGYDYGFWLATGLNSKARWRY